MKQALLEAYETGAPLLPRLSQSSLGLSVAALAVGFSSSCNDSQSSFACNCRTVSISCCEERKNASSDLASSQMVSPMVSLLLELLSGVRNMTSGAHRETDGCTSY